MRWDRIMPTAAVLAVVEGLILGYVFSGVFAGNGLDLRYWLLVGAIVAVTTLVAAFVVDRIARRWRSPADAALAGLIAGPLFGLVAGYLIQPRGGPT